MKFFVFVFALCAFTASVASEYQILMVLPVSTKYVSNVFCGVAKSLVKNRNKVSMISPHPPNFFTENFTVFKLDSGKSLLQGLNQFQMNSSSIGDHVRDIMLKTANSMWEGFTIKDILKVKDTFDAIMIPSFLNELAYPFLKDYKGVVVTLYSQGAEHFMVSRANASQAIVINPSLDDPYFESYSLQDKFIYSLSALNNLNVVENSGVFPGAQEIVNMFHRKFGNLEEYRSLSHLNLVDGHFALEGAAPTAPKQVEIGGIVAREPQDLPREIKDFLTTSKGEGIVYVSFGSNTRSSFIPRFFKDTLLEAFSRLPHKVLWQYEGMDLENRDNVYKKKVMPQQNILGHPSTVAFISHCSLPAMQEAAYHGVPVLALPVALDQHKNARKLQQRGLAVTLDWKMVTADDIIEAVTTLTNDPSYSYAMGNMSRVLKDQKESPGDRAAWWVEYTIRHQGAPHLQYDPAQFAVRSYCDHELLQLWAALAAALGFVAGAFLLIVCRALYDCIFSPKQLVDKNKKE